MRAAIWNRMVRSTTFQEDVLLVLNPRPTANGSTEIAENFSGGRKRERGSTRDTVVFDLGERESEPAAAGAKADKRQRREQKIEGCNCNPQEKEAAKCKQARK